MTAPHSGRWVALVGTVVAIGLSHCAGAPVPPTEARVSAAGLGATWGCEVERTEVARVPGQLGCLDAASWSALAPTLVGDAGHPFGPELVPALSGAEAQLYFRDPGLCPIAFDIRGCGQRQVFLCNSDGACAPAVTRTTYVTSDAECRALSRCAAYGECALGEVHRCRAASDADCQAATEACGIMGRCQLGPTGICLARDNSACAASSWCRELGRCEAVDGGCAAVTDAQCQAATECATRKRCRARDGICVNEPAP